jgi:hypothetical protein
LKGDDFDEWARHIVKTPTKITVRKPNTNGKMMKIPRINNDRHVAEPD